jgi:nitroreductase
MEFNELIRTRESVRNYDPGRTLPDEVLERILDAGRLAPSACNIQPWKFLVISSAGMLEMVKAAYQRDWFRDAPHVLIIVGSKEQAWKRSYDGYNSVETDLAIAMTHIILAAENEGVGACWIEAYNPVILREAIGTGEDQVIFGITPLGYQKAGYKKTGQKKRKSLEEIVKYL